METSRGGAVFIGAGANVPHPTFGSPRKTLEAAFLELGRRDVAVVRRSAWYRTEPVPASDQPWYTNVVAEVATALGPDELLAVLHGVEDLFGRVRTVRNAPRLIDLDLLDYRGRIAVPAIGKATLPHPRMQSRVFVLRPLAELAPEWRHPVTGVPIEALLAALPSGQAVQPA